MARDDRWQNLVTGAFHLDDELGGPDLPSAARRRRQLLGYLDNVLEVFPPDLDPVEDFEGYAVRRMAQSVRRALGAPARRPRSRRRSPA